MAKSRTIKQIAVDAKFFNTIFEKKRRELQTKLGINNLSQANFTKMIKDIKLTPIKIKPTRIKLKRKRSNDFFKI